MENRLNGLSASSFAETLGKTITWEKTYPIQTMDVIDRISAQLPKSGYMENFPYTDSGTIGINVQFDTRRDAVFFYTRLKE
ncbi:MAG: hypothetical protein ACI35O_15615 [Bacillaceae bacterium]